MTRYGDKASEIRIDAIASAPTGKRVPLGQHLTPLETARLAVSMLSSSEGAVRGLDLGAGSGMLSACLAERFEVQRLDAVEMDRSILPFCEETLSFLGDRLHVIADDAIACAPSLGMYDRVVLNPPYRKMRADDEHRAMLPVSVPNYYAAFLCIAAQHLVPGGEMVAIVPRSWMNGAYFKDFRRWFFSRCSVDAVHVYESRSDVFVETGVLQEIVLVKCSKRAQASLVEVSSSTGLEGEVRRLGPFPSASLLEADGDRVMRIAPDRLAGCPTLADLGLCVSTGKIVDFRVRERLLYSLAGQNAVPLLYPCNLHDGEVMHPVEKKKPQWLVVEDESSKNLVIPGGWYVLVRRFSAKEERRRIVASVLEVQDPVAIENHLNVIHSGTRTTIVPLEKDLARGLALWLNSSPADESFRLVGGSTQVNARDLLAMPVPPVQTLLHLGTRWNHVEGDNQAAVDNTVEEALEIAV